MAGYKCPFCNQVMTLINSTSSTYYIAFENAYSPSPNPNQNSALSYDNTLKIDYLRCPNCNMPIIKAKGLNNDLKGLCINIFPQSDSIQFPNYIPSQIIQDYEESCAIVNLSPKASATLSRRCLQGMIHDFWGIKQKNLNAEITDLKDKIHPTQWKVIDGLRRLGNIGAHMEKDINLIVDIDSDEALKLIKLIELLINDWYIKRHDQEELYNDILAIDSQKQEQIKG